MKVIAVLALLTLGAYGYHGDYATECNSCDTYCECIKASKDKLDKPAKMVGLEELKAALKACHKPETAPSTKNTDKIEKFFACRNAKCTCAEDVAPAVGLALGMNKAIVAPEAPVTPKSDEESSEETDGAAPPAEAPKSRKRRQAETKAANNMMLQCLEDKLAITDSELTQILSYYKATEETYMYCYETECRDEADKEDNEDIAEADKRCSLFAGFSV